MQTAESRLKAIIFRRASLEGALDVLINHPALLPPQDTLGSEPGLQPGGCGHRQARVSVRDRADRGRPR